MMKPGFWVSYQKKGIKILCAGVCIPDLCAGDVDNDYTLGLELSGLVGGEERSVELICHDDFVC